MQKLTRLQCVPNVDDKSVFDICFDKALHGSVQIINWDNLNLGCYVVLGCKINHLLCLLHASDITTSYHLSSCNISKVSA
ncbi:hypothetical protein PRUPE_6G207000 [Prunus persica]|uniref:Uncharacterized protein n=1 Tax=Prunus persica TaxID=3760 RepID=A0A251NTB7_PRUPE|nr:hypothetical protein PRUPE_6G207000 [Prunus persica]